MPESWNRCSYMRVSTVILLKINQNIQTHHQPRNKRPCIWNSHSQLERNFKKKCNKRLERKIVSKFVKSELKQSILCTLKHLLDILRFQEVHRFLWDQLWKERKQTLKLTKNKTYSYNYIAKFNFVKIKITNLKERNQYGFERTKLILRPVDEILNCLIWQNVSPLLTIRVRRVVHCASPLVHQNDWTCQQKLCHWMREIVAFKEKCN